MLMLAGLTAAERLDKLEAIRAYDEGVVALGVHDESLRAELADWLRSLGEEEARLLLSRHARDQYLTEGALGRRYGIEDVAALVRWLDERMGYSI